MENQLEEDNNRRKPRPGEIPGSQAVDTHERDAAQLEISKRFAANDPRLNAPYAHETFASAEDFLTDHRIHVKHGSLFVGEGLALHPAELDPKNTPQLRAKLENSYKFNSPSFYDDPKRAMIAVHLGTLVPASLESERASLMGHINAFNTKLEYGVSEQALEAASYRLPMEATANELTQADMPVDPLGLEYATNGVAFYLMLREAMTRHGYTKPMTEYVKHFDSPNQVLDSFAEKLGLNLRNLRETALGGLGDVAQALGIDDATAYDILAMSQYAAQNRFSLNAIEHWHIGRQLAPNGTIEEKIAAGMPARIDRDMQQYRAMANGQYTVPEAVQKQERFVADALNLIEPVERDLLFRLGYQIGYTPDRVADDIADFSGILGLHRKLANDLRDIDGNYYIYFAGQMDEKKALRTLRHEIAHNLWPTRFSEQERQEIDLLIDSDNNRLQALNEITTTHKQALAGFIDAYQTGNASEKKRVLQRTNQYFAGYGIGFDDIMPHLNGVEQLRWMVSEAHDRLRVDGSFYNKTAYFGASTRFREMISRYSELQYVAHREQPDMQKMLQFVVPGMHTVFNQHYLDHLARVREEVMHPNHFDSGTIKDNQLLAGDPGNEPKDPPLPVSAAQSINASKTPQSTVHTESIQQLERAQATLNSLTQLGVTGQHNGACSR